MDSALRAVAGSSPSNAWAVGNQHGRALVKSGTVFVGHAFLDRIRPKGVAVMSACSRLAPPPQTMFGQPDR